MSSSIEIESQVVDSHVSTMEVTDYMENYITLCRTAKFEPIPSFIQALKNSIDTG